VANLPSHGGERDRTADLLNAIQALSQLSYAPDIPLITCPVHFVTKTLAPTTLVLTKLPTIDADVR
jgi:hypothetical protein